MARSPRKTADDESALLPDDPLWFKDAIIYELHVKTFHDGNGDGVGDFAGLIEKLDYLQDLGVTAIWILPFYPSPLRDDGYDIAEYLSVNPTYGTLPDFKRFLKEAHARGLRVITELVINHTSIEHAWFQRARRAPKGSKYRDWYVWSDDPDKYEGTRIIFQDFESSNWTWDPVAEQYYWHRFYAHQPDLNFDNLDVQKAVFKAFDFWMDLGVDGMRLDAVPYLYEREGTNCENLAETHGFLKKLRTHIDRKYKNRMLLAEANQWPEDAAAYFGAGDECHMNFHFPLMPRMFMALQLENNFPILDILAQTPTIADNCQWAVFLRNHDELTLEMVTDEDRDYMYRVYATDPQARINLGIRRRLAPLMKERRKVELLNGLLLSMPGTPVVYYGDEIGMGDNIYLGDRDGVRTPMQWSSDRNAGFSRANPQKLYLPVIIDPEYHYESVNVEAQQHNAGSLLWWMKRIIALRNQYQVFGRGDFQFLDPENSKVLAFTRSHGNRTVLVVANLSRFAQFTELDLSRYQGMIPMELFGQTEFPAIGDLPYLLSLGPHAFYWFELCPPDVQPEGAGIPVLDASGSWATLLTGRTRRGLERALPRRMVERRWFRGKAQKIKGASIVDAIPLETEEGRAYLVMVEIDYVQAAPETYVLPMAFATGERAKNLLEEWKHTVVARVRVKSRSEPDEGVIFDPLGTPAFSNALLDLLVRRRSISGHGGELVAESEKRVRAIAKQKGTDLEPWVIGVEQTNTSVVYGEALVLKVFRMLEQGESPDLEVGGYLTRRTSFEHAPPVEGSISYELRSGEIATLGILQAYVANQGDAWKLTVDSLGQYFERALARQGEEPVPPVPDASFIELARTPPPDPVADVIAHYLPLVRLLGERTAEMHLALAGELEDPAFVPESFTELRQRSLYQAARTRLNQTFKMLRRRGALDRVGDDLRERTRGMLARQAEIDERLRGIVDEKIDAVRIRVHGDYHLGQVLYTGKDFVIIDFEGEPARPIGERRFKRSPLLDVAGMLRSFHYATVSALHHGPVRADDRPVLEPWAHVWHRWVSAAFLGAYLEKAAGSEFIPPRDEQREVLLDFCMLDKCIYELGYELNNRPDWLGIPLRGLSDLLGETE